MSIKTGIALAAALFLSAGSIALAADNDQRGGYRELGPGGAATQGINPADHPSLSGDQPAGPKPNIQTEGRGPSAGAPPKPQDNYGSEAGKE